MSLDKVAKLSVLAKFFQAFLLEFVEDFGIVHKFSLSVTEC
jgi:hypothetical protein